MMTTTTTIPSFPPLPKEWDIPTFSIVGGIGVGKSTLVRLLAEGGYLAAILNELMPPGDTSLKIGILRENSDHWEKLVGDDGLTILEYFYGAPEGDKHIAFEFQTFVYTDYVDRVHAKITAERPDVLLVERTMYCQRIFWSIQQNKTSRQDMIYERQWSKWAGLVPAPKAVFFLQTSSVEKTMDRIHERARDGEVARKKPSEMTQSLSGAVLSPRQSVGDTREVTSDNDEPMWREDDVAEEQDGGREEEEEETSGVTLAYQTRLLQAHHRVYPPGRCTPFDAGHELEVVYVDADPPYHREPKHLKKIAYKIARVIASQLKRQQYNAI